MAYGWNTALVDAEQDNNGVTVTLHDGHTIRTRWPAGCDDAHSTVRKIACIGFPGAPVADQWLLADVHMDWAVDRSGSHGWLHPDGIFGALPMHHFGSGEDVWRLMAYLPGVTEQKLDDQDVLDQFRQLTPQRTGRADARIRDAVRTSAFRIHRRLADSYRSGRILLVGDAAHIHSPLGGQGMLTEVVTRKTWPGSWLWSCTVTRASHCWTPTRPNGGHWRPVYFAGPARTHDCSRNHWTTRACTAISKPSTGRRGCSVIGQVMSANFSTFSVGPATMSVSPGMITVSAVAYVKSWPRRFTQTTVTAYLERIPDSPNGLPTAHAGAVVLTIAKLSSNSM